MQTLHNSTKISEYIRQKLIDLECVNSIKIVLAIESGSRAWGFPSMDSDYDVRFIYVRPLNDYLSVSPHRDTLETPLVHDDRLGVPFDLNGWDVQKALRLATQSNPVLIEWLTSPIRYIDMTVESHELLSFTQEIASIDAIRYHYQRLCQHAWAQIQSEPQAVKLKLYCYALRPALSLLWMTHFAKAPPMDLPTLRREVVKDLNLDAEISQLLSHKLQANEADRVPRNSVLDSFIESVMQHMIERPTKILRAEQSTMNQANELFRNVVKRGYPE